MADREKVIKGFENCVFNHCDDDCMYKDEEWKDSGFSACRHFEGENIVEIPKIVLLDVLELMKSQEQFLQWLARLVTHEDGDGAECEIICRRLREMGYVEKYEENGVEYWRAVKRNG